MINKINELVEELNKYCFEYYALDNPIISDKQFDEKYDELVKLEKETGYVHPNSPTQRVGDKILEGFEKVEHKNKLWSLDKSQSFDDLKEWHNRNLKFIKEYNKTHKEQLPPVKYIVTKKYDGLTVKCDYEDNIYIKGSSRGTGEIGENLTEQVKTVINLPKQLNNNDTNFASFHGEGLMTKKGLKEYNKTAKIPLKNCRNGVAGALRNLDVSEASKRKPIIIFYNINDIDIKFETYHTQLDYMKDKGLPVTEYTICDTYETVIDEINKIEIERPNLPYDIDGAVITIDDVKTRELLGYTIKFPKYAIAYKYEAEETTTKLIDVEWNVSRQGKIVPTGILEPVELNGVTVSRATLNNLTDIKRKGIKLNSIVPIRRSNDVIPEITGVIEESLNNEDVIDIEIPNQCPCCGSLTEIRQNKESQFLHCTNDSCSDRIIKSLTHFASKEAMNINGLSIETIKLFINNGFIKHIKDIFELEQYKAQIVKLPKFGAKKYTNLINSIEKSKSCKLNSFLYSLGIDGIGRKASKDICEYFNNDLEQIMNTNIDTYLKIEGIGDITADSIVDYFQDNDNITRVKEVLKYVTFIEDKPIEVTSSNNPLSGKHIYPTGKFSLNKSELKIELQKLGAIVEPSYKKSLDYLITANDTSKTGKVDKAIKDGVALFTEEELLKLISHNK
jgi:DNA ligase (NAD+)